MTSRSRAVWPRQAVAALGLLSLALGGACSSSKAAPPPVEGALGRFRVRIEPDPLRIVITGQGERVLFDGLAPRDPAPPTEDAPDPAPLAGLAVRDLVERAEMRYGAFQFTDPTGTWRIARRATDVTATAASIALSARDDAGVIATVAIASPADGEIESAVEARTAAGAGRTWAQLGARCAKGDRYLGFGGQARDVDHRGSVVPLFVTEPGIGKRDDDRPSLAYFLAGTRHASSFPAPIYLAKSGYVGALDGLGRATFGMCAEEDALRVAQDVHATRKMVYRLFDGPRPVEALGRATARYGRPRTPPRLAFAPWNDALFGSDNVRAHAKRLRDEDVHSSAVWTEDFRGGAFAGDNYTLEEEWAVDTKLYPDFPKLAQDLHARGFAFLSYFNTFVEKDLHIWKETEPKGHLVKQASGGTYLFTNAKQRPSGIIDLTSKDAHAFVVGKLRENLGLGANGWMGDFAEWLPLDGKMADGSDPYTAHQAYPLAWQRAQRDALDADVPGAPPVSQRVMFVRSGWLGTAPLADVVWAGDQRTDFQPDDGLPTIVPMGLGLGIAGISTYGSDIGGYQVALTVPTTKEVYFRWTELGAWSPVMRTHHTTQPKLSWSWDRDAETISHYRRYAIVHQQLLPVWESLAREASSTGVPIWRHLGIVFPSDEEAWKVGDQFMVGSSILVAPVVTAAASKKVYFPGGARWIPWEPGAVVEGGRTADVAAPLGEIPVFVRAGTALALLPDTVRTVLPDVTGIVRVEDVKDDRVVLAFLGPDATFTEVGGLSVAMTGADGTSPVTFAAFGAATWAGAPLPTCGATPAAPCVKVEAGRATAFVEGPGVLAAAGAKVDIRGGHPKRKLTVVVR